MEVQVRFEDGELRYFPTLKEALLVADRTGDPTVWKISFGLPNGERVRLVRLHHGGPFVLDQMDQYIDAAKAEAHQARRP